MFYATSKLFSNGLHSSMLSKVFARKINWRDFLPAFILVVNSITWYTLIYAMFDSSIMNLKLPTSETLTIFIVHFLGIAISAMLGAKIFPRLRMVSLLCWILGGASVSALLTTIPYNSSYINLLVSLLLGISFGIGLPSSLAYFANATSVENRGIHGGVTWSAIGFGILLLAILIAPMDLLLTFVTLAVWRGIGAVFFLLPKKKEVEDEPSSVPSSYISLLTRTDVTLYLVPWIMFCIINFIEQPIVRSLLGDFYTFGGFINFALTGVFALIGGLFSDIVGRKRVIITGFVMVGIEYAVLSLFSGASFSWYLYILLDGVAWGMFASVFLMTLWGDLAGIHRKEKYYVVGGLTYILAGFLPIPVRLYIDESAVRAISATAFSIASFFLFLAVLPLMYAPETLPEKKIKERELRDYVEKAKKTKDKYV